ncbi:MAG TPA: isoprenyl transferase [Phycisphaerae bacterium]|nr:isoprenyl transferase [Phycisphaerae bacterium]
MSQTTIADELQSLGLTPAQLPRHVAIIMDGNGRWAKQRGKSRSEGHRAGAEPARAVAERAARLGIQQLTLYSFSMENWRRPAEEISRLMQLYMEFLTSQCSVMLENNIRFRQIGRREGLPVDICREVDKVAAALEKNTGMTLCLAVNYGSRSEIVDAVRNIARRAKTGQIDPESIDELMISENLYTAGMPDPDLLIRTAGELRLSNFLLWQLSYAEFYVTDLFWPDFSVAEFDKALISYAHRRRRFGGLGAE